MNYKLLILVILLIYLYPFLISQEKKEGIQFYESYMKPYYTNNNIINHSKHELFEKDGKFVSYATGLNDPDAKKISKDKYKTKQLLLAHNIPTPKYYYWDSDLSLQKNINKVQNKLKFPIVIKPNSLEQGASVYTNIHNKKDAISVLKNLLSINNDILIEEQIVGNSYRILIFNDHFIDAYQILKPSIVGDGKHTVSYLVKDLIKNAEKPLNADQVDYNLIKEQGYNKNSIPPKHKKITITNVSNGSIGSAPKFIAKSDIHPDNLKMFKKINKIIGLNANGIDYITTDLSIPYYEYGSVLESNSSPGIEFHHKNNPASIDKFMKLIKFE